MHGNTKYGNSIELLLISNFNKLNNDELSKLLDLDKIKIRYLMDKLGLKRDTKVSPYRKRNSLNRNDDKLRVLLEDNLNVFYWIGFLLADGWIRKVPSGTLYAYQLGIELSIKDYDHLKKFANLLNIDCTIRTRNTNFKYNYKMCSIKLTNYNIIKDIINKYDINLNKTTNPPNPHNYKFNNDQLLAMFIGFIDGDGSISKRRKLNGFQSIISIQTKKEWQEWLEFMLELVKGTFDPKIRAQVRTNIRNHAYLCLTKHAVLEDLKQFAINNQLPILERKWDMI